MSRTKNRKAEVFINIKIPTEVRQTLDAAKKATGASFKFLVTQSVLQRWADFRPGQKASA